MASVGTGKSQNSFLRQFGAFFRRFHMIIFFVIVVGCLAAAVLLINDTLTDSTADEYTSGISAGSIDKATLERLQSLHPSSQPGPAPQMPAGRTNPFAE